jgi:hypothetical protein
VEERTLRLDVDGRATSAAPSFVDVQNALNDISPLGPSHFNLSDQTGSYVQAAGARLRLSIEYRKVHRFGFRHFVLGDPNRPTTPNSINSTAGIIKLQTNEILTLVAALEVFREFFETGTVPARFVLHETTDMFC